jgi:hypothetical protein
MALAVNDLWDKLPLAEAFWLFLHHVWPVQDLEEFYEQHRGRHYTRQIRFPTVVALLLDAIMKHDGRAYPILQKQNLEGELPATIQAIYAKIRRMPRELSHALLAASTQKLFPLMPTALTAPPAMPGG